VSRLIGLLPAAGTAERLQPLAGSKEMLELGGRPVLEYAVDRLRAAHPDEIRVVLRPEKADVAARAGSLGLEIVEARPRSLAESILSGIAPLAGDDLVLVDLPDSIWEPVDGFTLLLPALTDDADVVLGAFGSAEPERGDVVELAAYDSVVAVHVKRPDPPGDLVWGAFAARAGVLKELHRHAEPGHLFDQLARRGRVRAVRFPGEFTDIGTKEALSRARELLGT
jgi:NDP-sugar pyrophosphorylase family protein